MYSIVKILKNISLAALLLHSCVTSVYSMDQDQLSADFALALSLAEEAPETQEPSATFYVVPKELRVTAEQQSNKIFNTPQGAGVHQVNVATLNAAYQVFDKIGREHMGVRCDIAPADVVEQLKEANVLLEFEAPKYANAMRMLTQHMASFRANSRERETGANSADLLSQAWDLSRRIDEDPRWAGNRGMSHRILFVDSLSENVEGRGGCFAGVIGRLVVHYVRCVNLLIT